MIYFLSIVIVSIAFLFYVEFNLNRKHQERMMNSLNKYQKDLFNLKRSDIILQNHFMVNELKKRNSFLPPSKDDRPILE